MRWATSRAHANTSVGKGFSTILAANDSGISMRAAGGANRSLLVTRCILSAVTGVGDIRVSQPASSV